MFALSAALVCIIGPLLAAAQYSCPQIKFAQTLTPVANGQSSDHASFMLSFVNTSPSLPLEFLDVHFRINDEDLQNFRLIESDRSSLHHYPIESVPLQHSDTMEYFFTYSVAGTHFACDTQHFHVTGAQVLDHLSDTPIQNVLAADSPAVRLSRNAQAEQQLQSGSQTAAAAPFHQAQDFVNPNAVSSQPARAAPAPAAEDEKLDQNEGICPLIPFEQKMLKSAKSNEYTLSFINKSPSTPLDFLDVHFRINDGPISNLRLFTDPSQQNKGNDERALEGLVLAKGDEIYYAYTYGLKEQDSSKTADGEQKIRACNTAVYHAIAA